MKKYRSQSEHASDQGDEMLKTYAAIVTNEARRRGFKVKILDVEPGYFSLSFADRSIVCGESLFQKLLDYKNRKR